MSTYSFKLPDIGEGIAEAEVVAWHVAVGDIVEEDAPLADLMTDKATVEIGAPVSGKVVALFGEVGAMVAIGSVLAKFEVTGDATESAASGGSLEDSEQKAPIEHKHETVEASEKLFRGTDSSTEPTLGDSAQPEPGQARSNNRVLASPAIRRRAKDLGIDLANVVPAVDGRLRHADLDAFLRYNAQGGYAISGSVGVDEQIKVVGLRRRIAEKMAASKRNIPHFTYVEEIDVTKLEEMRGDLNAVRGSKPKLTILPFLITAICKVLPDYPMLNARFDGDAGIISRFGNVHLGMATQTEAGLMVPVIRNAESKNLWQLATEIGRLAELARTGKAKSNELSGSTLTITSLGALGGIATTPVINHPEVAIIGPNKVVERLVIKNGEIEIAKLMNISMSCDHRVIDGWDAAKFVQDLKHMLETPARLFVD